MTTRTRKTKRREFTEHGLTKAELEKFKELFPEEEHELFSIRSWGFLNSKNHGRNLSRERIMGIRMDGRALEDGFAMMEGMQVDLR